ncbi:hypothetical protein BCR41DRAFT_344601, partial [Lobosporangium transversale]
MGNHNTNPLDIPEIISIIGSFLDRTDIIRCICVSKTFHFSLIGLIWKRINVRGLGRLRTYRIPTNEALEKHKKYIEELDFDDFFASVFSSLQGCNRLRLVEYHTWKTFKRSNLSELSDLIKSHSSTITELRLRGSSLRGAWSAVLECAHLEALVIFEACIPNDEVDPFFQVCKKIKTLMMHEVHIDQLPRDFLDEGTCKYIFPNIQRLLLWDTLISCPPHPYTSKYCFGILTRRCPELRSLNFLNLDQDIHPSQRLNFGFYKVVFLEHQFTLSNLSSLYTRAEIRDEDMATLLKQMTELRRLEVPYCDFGPLSLRELLADEQEILEDGQIMRRRRDQRLCDTVEILIFRRQSGITDGIAQPILSNCPCLRKLEGPNATVTEIADGAEWVCTGLTRMRIGLKVDVDQWTAQGKEKRRIVYERIRGLTQLAWFDSWEFRRLLSFPGL